VPEADEGLGAAAGETTEEQVDHRREVLEGEAVLEDPTHGLLERVGAPSLPPAAFRGVRRA
jgi:hypothetical protein